VATIEIEEFQLARGVTDEGFCAMDATYQEYCYLNRSGLLRRTTARSGDGWAVVTVWSGPSESAGSGATAAWLESIDEGSYSRRQYDTLE
jgi:hypothetical protein